MTRIMTMIAAMIVCVCALRAVNLLEQANGTLRMIHIELHHLNWDRE